MCCVRTRKYFTVSKLPGTAAAAPTTNTAAYFHSLSLSLYTCIYNLAYPLGNYEILAEFGVNRQEFGVSVGQLDDSFTGPLFELSHLPNLLTKYNTQ